MLEIAQAAILIFLAEIGDKTFFVAVLLAAKYHALPVFIGCMLALALSTILAAIIGYLISGLLGPTELSFIAAALFLGFAVWLLWEWYSYDGSAEKEAEEELSAHMNTQDGYGATWDTDLSSTRSSTDAFPSASSMPWWRVVALAFSMNFIGELGDKTQIAVAVQASTSNPVLVAIGALIGFTLVTAIAVLFGKTIAKFLSPRVILLMAAIAFFCFGIMAFVQGMNLLKEKPVKSDSSSAQFLNVRMVTMGLEKGLAGVGFLFKSPVLEKNAPVRGTSWDFHSVFGCGLLAGLLLALLIVLVWKWYVKPDHYMKTPRDAQASSSWEPLPANTNPEYAPLTLHLFTHRCGWLVALLLVQSLSAEVLESFKVLLRDHPNIIFFLTMLVGAGGNSGAQSAVLAVRQIALKQIVHLSNQLVMGCKLAAILALVALWRCFLFGVSWSESWTIAAALATIVVFAVLMGTALPLLLDTCKVDPAHSIATIQVLMDIFGVCIMCFMGVLLLDYVTAAPH